ncbi:MAG: hypothetical protein OEW09_15430 [Anaerolineae bacterium]|nr:hypothetical protein [Anaerolineae bacterium]
MSTPALKKGATPYYEETYDKEAESRRASRLFSIFAVLLVAILLLWIWFHLPYLFVKGVDNPWKWFDRKSDDPTRYLDWLLASLGGVLLYVLAEVAKWKPKIRTKEARFRENTAWYISTVLKGPIIAVVVLWLLTTLELKIGGTNGESGVGVDFANMVPIVLTGAAFILGFYSRVARTQLDEIARFLFRRAWALAQELFEVAPREAKVVFEKQLQFKTDPLADVTWTADTGTIDASGLYTAPKRSETATPGTRVLIRAALRSDPSISGVATVTLVPFKLVAEKTEMVYGESQQLSVEGAPSEGLDWEYSLGTMEGFKYTAPSQQEAEDAGVNEVTITAKRKLKEGEKEEDRKEDVDSLTIKLIPAASPSG